MKSLLQPYIEKQILLEDEESEKNSAKAKGNMYVLVWDVLNSQGITSGFAHKLSDYISKIIAGKKPNPPSSKNLKSSEVKNLVSYGETIAQKWHGWDWKKNPPTPVSASWEDTWGGGRTSYNWGGMPSEKATPANMVDVYGSDSEKHISKLDGYDEVVNKDEPASTIEPEEPKQNEPESREEHSSAEQQAVLKAKREIRNEFDDYKWKNWGGSAVAQQMSSWSGSAEKRPALEKEIRDMLALFGPTKTLITGDDATKIKSGKISDFKKVFMQIGEKPVPEIEKDPGWTTWMWNEIKHFADNEKYAVRLMDRDILEDFLEDKSKSLYINTANGEDDFFWENEPSAGGGQIDKSTVNRDTILSKETDPMKYVPGILAWAEKPDQRQKLHTWMKKQVDNPNHNAKFKLGGEQIPANIFYDRNYVNAHWQDWAKNYDPGLGKVEPYKPVPAQNRDFDDWKREEDAGVAAWKDKYGKTHNWKDGSVKVKMPIWDKVESKWKPNNSGASPLEQPDMKDFMQRGGKDPGAMQQDADDDSDKSVAILMLSLLGFAAGPIGAGVASSIASVSTKLTAQGIASAGLGWLGIHFKSLSDEHRREMALQSSIFASNLKSSFQFQNKGYWDMFQGDLGDTGSIFARMLAKNPKVTADQILNFRKVLNSSGTLMYTGGSPDQGANENINIKNINVENNTSFMRSALDFLSEDDEAFTPVDLSGTNILKGLDVTDEEIKNANLVLSWMGIPPSWKFVQPENNTSVDGSGFKGASGGTGTYIEHEDGKTFVVQTLKKPRTKDDLGGDTESEEVVKVEVPNVVAAEQTMELVKQHFDNTGHVPPASVYVDAAIQGVEDSGVDVESTINPPDEQCEWWWEPGTSDKKISGENGKPGPAFVCLAYKRDDKKNDAIAKAVNTAADNDQAIQELRDNPKGNAIAQFEPPKSKPDEPESKIDEPKGLTPEQIEAIKRRLSRNGEKSGPRDPGLAWAQNLQDILKIGPNGAEADFIKRWNEVQKFADNSTATGQSPLVDTDDVPEGVRIVPAGTRIKMYDDALTSPTGEAAEIMKQVIDSDEKWAAVWEKRKNLSFTLKNKFPDGKEAAAWVLFYYFGIAIQVALTKEQYLAMTGTKTKSSDPKDVSAEPTDIAKHLKVLLGDAQFKAWKQTTKELTRQEKLCLLDMILKGNTLVIEGTK